MDQIEIILRTTDPAGKVTEQILAKFDTEEPAIGSGEVLQYSGLCIDPVQHQISYQRKAIPLTETYEFQTLVYLHEGADLPGSLEGGAGGCKQCGILYHRKYPPKAEEGYKERIYPDRVGNWIQICGCPRGMSPWDFFRRKWKTMKSLKSV